MEKKEIRWCRLDRKEALNKLPFTISNLVNKYKFRYRVELLELVYDIDAYLEKAMSTSGYIKQFWNDGSTIAYWVVFTNKFITVYYMPHDEMPGKDINQLYENIWKAIVKGREEE